MKFEIKNNYHYHKILLIDLILLKREDLLNKFEIKNKNRKKNKF